MAVKIYRSPLPDIQLPRTNLISSLFSTPTGTSPSTQAFIDARSGLSLTRQQVINQTKNVANGLHRLGARSGDVVAVLSPNSVHYSICCYATLYSGAVLSPISAALTEEIRGQLVTSCAEMLFVHESLAQIAQKPSGFTDVTHIIQMDENQRSPYCDALLLALSQEEQPQQEGVWPPQRYPDDTAFVCFSSGTSDPTKGVVLTHGNITANIQQWDRMYHSERPASLVAVNFLPFSQSQLRYAEQ